MAWTPGQLVRHIDDVAKLGTVTDQVRTRASGQQVLVNWSGRLDWHFPDELANADIESHDPLDLIKQGRYGRVDNLRTLMTHVHLVGRLSNVIYAMGLTQTDFYPHQYKPLLTLLDSPVNGLLIADEVGLGKTIEAGLIWTELRARFDMRRLLVVCPAMLREKWKHELLIRFGIDASCVNATDLLSELKNPDRREKALIVSYQGIRTPNEWSINDQDRTKKRPTEKLADYLYQHADSEPLIDLVIFDEAHYMRNQNTGAWKTGNFLKDVSAYQIMLSATPINLGSEDLFSMLRLLDPDHFGHQDDFNRVLWANKPVIKASDVVRNTQANSEDIITAIEQIKRTRWYQKSERVDRLIDEVKGITQWTHKERIDIAAKLERFNMLAHLVSRTRKREVQQERVLRQADIFEAEMRSQELELYQAVTEGTRRYAITNDIKHGFLLSIPQRMVSSSPVALLKSWQDASVEQDVIDVLVDEANEDEDVVQQRSSGIKSYLASRTLNQFTVKELTKGDSKYALFSEQIRRFFKDDKQAKAIVFTTFRGTAKYLVERLGSEGIPSTLLMGGSGFDKDSIVTAFRNDNKSRLLICTDVASEGVDLQFCRLIINYDLPWNPMRIEQRIGRIDRIGQQSKRILIWNFVYKDTIDAKILSRLTSRIGVFESTFGETESILGEVRKLEDVLLSQELTPEEEARMIDEVAFAIENVKRKQEELEQEAIQLVAHGQKLLAQIETSRSAGNIISKHDLINYIDSFIQKASGCRMNPVMDEQDLFEISLNPSTAAEFDEFIRRKNLLGKTNLHTGQARRCLISEKITEKQTYSSEMIHRFHPLIQFISFKNSNVENTPSFPLYACKVTPKDFDEGQYVVLARVVSFNGIKDEETVLVAAINLNTQLVVDDRIAETLFEEARKSGQDWINAQFDIDTDISVKATEQLEIELRQRFRTLKQEKQNENIDRTEVLLHLANEHLNKKLEGFSNRIANHKHAIAFQSSVQNAQRRKALANAERKKMEDFNARMVTKIANIERKRDIFTAEARDICVLMVQVSKDA
ncbi:SNF2-related protein [Rheinheimera aquimaris]|uniref:SNF2-related protein n=1 Tax=Rheinheimera aquimaris TaxID=412437 RepID=UPI003A9697B9